MKKYINDGVFLTQALVILFLGMIIGSIFQDKVLVILSVISLASFILLFIPYEVECRCIIDVCRKYMFNPIKVFRAYKFKILPLVIYINISISVAFYVKLVHTIFS